ncbi:hypothetical protein HDU98_008972 [Podochytrium sp. JEL0797]|nr:hypothetical protein HDU98_008972 [Podochytrium sp. JEL0797]
MHITTTQPYTVIVGGGITGLLTLEKTLAAGITNVVLVSATPLGQGQSLHNHGWLHNGYIAAANVHFSSLINKEASWINTLIDTNSLDASRNVHVVYSSEKEAEGLGRAGLPFKRILERDEIPDLFQTDLLFGKSKLVEASKERIFDKEQVIHTLSKHLQHHIVGGKVVHIDVDLDKRARCVQIETEDGSSFTLNANCVVLAAGSGSQDLIRTISNHPSDHDHQQSYPMTMLCIRGPATVLPEFSILHNKVGWISARHIPSTNETVYVAHQAMFGDPHPLSLQENPTDSTLPSHPKSVQNVFTAVMHLIPTLRLVFDQIKFGAYTVLKTDGPGGIMYVSALEAVPNVVVAHPGLYVMADGVAQRVVDEHVRKWGVSAVEGNEGELDALRQGKDVLVGLANEDMVAYHSFAEFQKLFGIQ